MRHHTRRTRYLGSWVLTGLIFLALLQGAPGLGWHLTWGTDHGYQLSLGSQILHGKRPYVDLFFHYGPLTAYTSALGLWLHPSLVPETVICALGYAAAVGLLAGVVRRFAGLPASVLVAAVNVLLLARFYKWYYWLFPVLTFSCLLLQVRFVGPFRRNLPLGLAAGLAFLYRPDLGLGCLALGVVGTALLRYRRTSLSRWTADVAVQGTAFLAPILAWLVVLSGYGGWNAVADYARSYRDGFVGATQSLSLPFPALTWGTWRDLLSWQTGLGLCYRLLPATALLGGLWAWPRPGRLSLRDRVLGCACAGALIFFPQALHRCGTHHLFQVLPLFTLAAALVLARFWTARRGESPAPRRVRRAVALSLGAVLALSVWDLRPFWCTDLAFGQNPLRKYQAMARRQRSAPTTPAAQLDRFLSEQTGPADTVWLLNHHSQFLVFADRKCAGYLTAYVPGVLSSAYWQQRNLDQVKSDAPKFVVLLENSPIDGRPENEVPAYLPVLWAYVQQAFPATVFRAGNLVVRARLGSEPRP